MSRKFLGEESNSSSNSNHNYNNSNNNWKEYEEWYNIALDPLLERLYQLTEVVPDEEDTKGDGYYLYNPGITKLYNSENDSISLPLLQHDEHCTNCRVSVTFIQRELLWHPK